MGSFKSILCCIDNSPHSLKALRSAAALAREVDAALVLLHVEAKPSAGMTLSPFPSERTAPPPMEDRWCRIASDIRHEPVPLHYATGNAAEQIVEFAGQFGCDLIVLGSRARTPASLALGSVAAKVLVHARCPVLIVRDSENPASAI
ncbi:MAG TPA: universal stress protein [Myxococcales bacterium]